MGRSPIRSIRIASALTKPLAMSESRTASVLLAMPKVPRNSQEAPKAVASSGSDLLVDQGRAANGGAIQDGEGRIGGPDRVRVRPGGRDAIDARRDREGPGRRVGPAARSSVDIAPVVSVRCRPARTSSSRPEKSQESKLSTTCSVSGSLCSMLTWLTGCRPGTKICVGVTVCCCLRIHGQ